MRRLRVLILLPALATAAHAASEKAPAPAGAGALVGEGRKSEAGKADAKPEPVAINVGSPFIFETPLDQVHPKAAKVKLTPRAGRPAALLFWGTAATISKEDLVELDRFVKANALLARMDVYGVGSFSTERQKADDVRDMAVILGIETVPILADPDFQLSGTVGASQFPEIAIIDSRGILVAKGLRGLDHARLPGPVPTTAELLRTVAAKGTSEILPRVSQFYATDRLVGRLASDFELPLFSKDGFGKGKMTRLTSLLSGKRPAVLFFFSSTCQHCQVDVPQIVKFLAANPTLYDVVGITRIKNDTHRVISDAYFKTQAITFPILEDGGVVADLYKVTATPTSVFLSPGRNVVKASYYQHADLAGDYTKLHPVLMGAPPPAPPPRTPAWAFPLKAQDAGGAEIDFASFAGKPTIVHFWATWCVPCRKELPELLARLPDLKSKANVALVSVEDDPAALAKHAATTGLSYASYLRPHGGLAESIDFSRSVPRTYLLDPAGRVAFLQAGTLEWADDEAYERFAARLVGQ